MRALATRKNWLTTLPTGSSFLSPFLPHLSPRAEADLRRYRIPENCGHTRAKLTTPLPASQFTLPTHSRLNSGLVVLRPSASTFSSIVSFLHTDPRVATYGFPDQDLLADFFEGRFRPLSYRYNALKTLRYAHEEMWRDEDVKNVHYILKKPWQYKLPREDRDGETSAWCVHLSLLLLAFLPFAPSSLPSAHIYLSHLHSACPD